MLLSNYCKTVLFVWFQFCRTPPFTILFCANILSTRQLNNFVETAKSYIMFDLLNVVDSSSMNNSCPRHKSVFCLNYRFLLLNDTLKSANCCGKSPILLDQLNNRARNKWKWLCNQLIASRAFACGLSSPFLSHFSSTINQ